jgi:hypothetical protein
MTYLTDIKKYRPFLLIVSLLFLAIYLIENINGRFWLNDFKVYYSAADALKNGKTVYGESFGLSTGFYKYSPEVLCLFIPATYLPFAAASGIHFFFIGLFTGLSLLMMLRLVEWQRPVSRPNALLLLTLLCVLNHLVRELHLGNVNMLLLCLLIAVLYFDAIEKPMAAGLCFALALLFKPYLLVLAIPLFLYKKIKTLLFSAVALLSAGLLFLLFFGFNQGLQLHKAWFTAMLAHGDYLHSAHTIPALLQYYGLPIIQQSQQFYLMGLLLLVYLGAFILRPSLRSHHYFLPSYTVFLALLPNILITDTEHFLLAMPLVFLSLDIIRQDKNIWQIMLFALLIFAYGGNSSDLLGNRLSDQFESMGLLGLANVLLVIFFMFSLKLKKTK